MILLQLSVFSLLSIKCSSAEDGLSAREALKESMEDLTLRMYSSLASRGNQENFVFSPLSLHQVLSMLYFAASENSETSDELQTLLGGLTSKQKLGNYYQKLSSFYQQRESIKVGNSVWLQNNLNLKRNFSRDIERILGATAGNVDFTDSSTTNTINQWVKERTAGLIPSIVESFDPDTVIFMANALHFQDRWLYPFQETHLNGDSLDDIDFTLEDGSRIGVPMMLTKNEEIEFGTIGEAEGVTLAQVVHIPYISGKFRMKIIFPENTTEQPLQHLEDIMMTRNRVNIFSMKMNKEFTEDVQVIMPKFKVKTDMEISDWLKEAGVNKIFQGAELDAMLETNLPLAVSKIIQKSVITVDKEGTEGASATGVELVLLSGSFGKHIEINLDRPFIFLVEDISHNIPILVGRVKNPEGE